MANYGGNRDPLEELWKEILNIHWKYLETEESMIKIDIRKKLEGRLKEYISVVSHDRKFFLPETEHVLRKSITQMKDFSAFKGAIGFESISQYANNLFTKPWRKEYRIIKMYSGFYQHEIKNNLMDAERLFIAMGYTLLPNQTLILDGPICPDQVTNVSRDAMTAYVECQIMKQVNSELTSMSLATSWMEIFNFRECHVGDSSQTLKGLNQIIQSRHNHIMRKDTFALAIPPAPLPPSSHQYHQQQQQQQHQQAPHNQPPMCNSHCSVHPFNQAPANAYYNSPAYNQPPTCSMHMPQANMSYYQPQPQHHMPHSKSLDQYDSGNLPANGMVHHRLSLDHNYNMNHHQHLSPSSQQPQPMPFDCINHPYNQPNARAPLPYNLSNLGAGHITDQYYPPDYGIGGRMYSGDMYHPTMMQVPPQQHMPQIPTPVSDYHHQKSYDFSDTSSPMPENELITFSGSKPTEVKLRSSMKKSSRATPDDDTTEDPELDINELRLLKRNAGKSASTSTSMSSDIKYREGIGNYKEWNYVFQNLKPENVPSKNVSSRPTCDDKLAAELQLEHLKLTSNGHGPPKLYPKSNGDLVHQAHHRTSSTSSAVPQTKHRTKSVSTGTEMSNHLMEHQQHKQRTSSVMDMGSSRSNNQSNVSQKQKSSAPQPPKILVPIGQWSCHFCTFLNCDAKKICEMCSKSKDFFLDADKSPAAATCV